MSQRIFIRKLEAILKNCSDFFSYLSFSEENDLTSWKIKFKKNYLSLYFPFVAWNCWNRNYNDMLQVLVFIIKPQHPFSWHAVSKFSIFNKQSTEKCVMRGKTIMPVYCLFEHNGIYLLIILKHFVIVVIKLCDSRMAI